MSLCNGNCAGGHYTDFTDAKCPSNTQESQSTDQATINWGALAVGTLFNGGVTTGNVIKDNDILEGLIQKVNNEISRYNANPRHNESGGEIYFTGAPEIGTDPATHTILDLDVAGSSVKYNIWLNIVRSAIALQTAHGLTPSIESSPVDKSDGADIINADYINEIVQVLNGLTNLTGCGTVCKCNVVCNCNGNCGCNYSDERLKKNIAPITGTDYSKLINDIKVYSYDYKQDVISNLPVGIQYGVMAQELIEQGLNEFIQLDSNGYYQVNYGLFIPLLINEVQRTNQEKILFEERYLKMEERLNRMEKQLSKLDRSFDPRFDPFKS